MKNKVMHLMLTGLLFGAVQTVAMEGGGSVHKDGVVDTEEAASAGSSSSLFATGWGVTRKWVLPAAAVVGGLWTARECRGESRGGGAAAAVWGAGTLVQNGWQAAFGKPEVDVAALNADFARQVAEREKSIRALTLLNVKSSLNVEEVTRKDGAVEKLEAELEKTPGDKELQRRLSLLEGLRSDEHAELTACPVVEDALAIISMMEPVETE